MATPEELKTMLGRLKSKGYTLSDIADQCECSISVIHRIKTGETKKPMHHVAAGIIKMHDMRLPRIK